MCTAAAFSHGPGRVTVAEALALVDQDLTAATMLLGKPDELLTDKTQPPAFHLRLDRPSGIERIERIERASYLGAMLAVTATAHR